MFAFSECRPICSRAALQLHFPVNLHCYHARSVCLCVCVFLHVHLTTRCIVFGAEFRHRTATTKCFGYVEAVLNLGAKRVRELFVNLLKQPFKDNTCAPKCKHVYSHLLLLISYIFHSFHWCMIVWRRSFIDFISALYRINFTSPRQQEGIPWP